MSCLTIAPFGFNVRLNPKQPFADLIRAGRFCATPPDITSDRFTSPAPTVAEVQIRVATVAENHRPKMQDVLAWMVKEGLRPASAQELLAVAALRPRVRLMGGFWALGSRWQGPEGNTYVIGCSLWDERILRFSHVEPTLEYAYVLDNFFCVCE